MGAPTHYDKNYGPLDQEVLDSIDEQILGQTALPNSNLPLHSQSDLENKKNMKLSTLQLSQREFEENNKDLVLDEHELLVNENGKKNVTAAGFLP